MKMSLFGTVSYRAIAIYNNLKGLVVVTNTFNTPTQIRMSCFTLYFQEF